MRSLDAGKIAIVVLSLCIIACTFFWAETDLTTVPIGDAIRMGASAWGLVLPLYAILSLAALLRLMPGLHPVLFVLGVLFLPVAGFSAMRIDNVAGLQTGWGSAIGTMLLCVLGLVHLVLGEGDPTPMHSPLARLVYFGHYGHWRVLWELAERHRWQYAQEGLLRLHFRGKWRRRDMYIRSGNRGSIMESGYILAIAVALEKRPWRFVLPLDETVPSKKDQESAVRGRCSNARGKMVSFYLWPPPGRAVDDAGVLALQEALESNRRFLRYMTSVYAAEDGVWFRHRSTVRMIETAKNVEDILDWLCNLAEVIERHFVDDSTTDFGSDEE